MKTQCIGQPLIVITFKQKNGEMWEETYSSHALDILKKDINVYEIRYKDSGKLIYSRDKGTIKNSL